MRSVLSSSAEYAVAHHGYPRYTGDLDLFVEASVENGVKLIEVCREFGFNFAGLTPQFFTLPDNVVRIAASPFDSNS